MAMNGTAWDLSTGKEKIIAMRLQCSGVSFWIFSYTSKKLSACPPFCTLVKWFCCFLVIPSPRFLSSTFSRYRWFHPRLISLDSPVFFWVFDWSNLNSKGFWRQLIGICFTWNNEVCVMRLVFRYDNTLSCEVATMPRQLDPSMPNNLLHNQTRN